MELLPQTINLTLQHLLLLLRLDLLVLLLKHGVEAFLVDLVLVVEALLLLPALLDLVDEHLVLLLHLLVGLQKHFNSGGSWATRS